MSKPTTSLNPAYLCRLPRGKKARKRDGARQIILTLLALAFLTCLGYALEQGAQQVKQVVAFTVSRP